VIEKNHLKLGRTGIEGTTITAHMSVLYNMLSVEQEIIYSRWLNGPMKKHG
jgi:hypothetical protein